MPKILVAEDSSTQSVQIRGLLEAAGFEVEIVGNGVDALESLAVHSPTAVLTDLDMPEMNGLDLVVAIRRDYPHVPVVLMTAFGSEEIAVSALQSGAASYVPKRNLARDLIDTLQDVLEVARAGREETHLAEFLVMLEARFSMPSAAPPILAIVSYVQNGMSELQLGDETDRIRIGVALDTAIHDFLYHGNLELSAEQLQDAYHLEDAGQAYYQMLEKRSHQAPFADRKIQVLVTMSQREVRCVVSHEGPGFDPNILTQSSDLQELEGGRAKGWLLVKSFMDEVSFDQAGNEVTMVWRFGS